MEGSGWRVLVIEELDLLHEKVANFLKVALERQLPTKCVVVATSNSVEKLQDALAALTLVPCPTCLSRPTRLSPAQPALPALPAHGFTAAVNSLRSS